MTRIITLNLNGIRSAARKGWVEWLAAQTADVVCVQELKAQQDDLEPALANPDGLIGHFSFAQKKGYSGVGIYSRVPPRSIQVGFGCAEFDAEGRYIEADFGSTVVVSVYLPSGSSSEERQQAKFRFLEAFRPHLAALRDRGQAVVICGDLNIAHQNIDLRNWRSNQKNSGFLPEERAWLTGVFDELGWVDAYRKLHPDATDACYTWWSNRGAAWEKNVGWRLDYQLASPLLATTAKHADVFKAQRFSDHAPLTIDYDFNL
jgi:exodeoxyribonuclease-3